MARRLYGMDNTKPCAQDGCTATRRDGKWCLFHRDINLRLYVAHAKEPFIRRMNKIKEGRND